MLYRKVEIFKDDNRIDVLFRGIRIVQIGITEAGQAIIALPNEEQILLDNDLGVDLMPFDADVITRQRPTTWTNDLPTFNRLTIEDVNETLTFTRTDRNSHSEQSDEHLVSTEVRTALNAILDSYLDEPVQSRTRTAQITKDIAQRFDYPKYAVAGVRAALTKGIYGEFDELLAHRRQQRTRIVRTIES